MILSLPEFAVQRSLITKAGDTAVREKIEPLACLELHFSDRSRLQRTAVGATRISIEAFDCSSVFVDIMSRVEDR